MSNDDNVIPFPGAPVPPSPEQNREIADRLIADAGGPHAALAALHQMLGPLGLAAGTAGHGRRQPTLLPRRAQRDCYVVRIDLDEARPPIWRRLRLASDLTLPQVHQIIQVAMGWTDSHLHHFLIGAADRDWQVDPFLTGFDFDEGEEGISEDTVRLDQVITTPGDRLFYDYDFGDNWHHTLRLEKVEPWNPGDPLAVCTGGRRACPPEDIGGIHGYHEALEVLAGRTPPGADDDWVQQLLTWLPPGYDPAAFSITDTNTQLAAGPLPDLTQWHPGIADLLHRYSGSPLSPLGTLIGHATTDSTQLSDEQTEAAVRPYQHLLRTVGDGIKLTAAGYLPPRIVETLYTDLEMDQHWIGKGNREDLTYPVLQLRESATALGLLRKHTGRLTLTRTGRAQLENPAGLLAHIASRLPAGRRPEEHEAGLIALLHSAAGPLPTDPDLSPAAILYRLNWRVSGTTLERAARHWEAPTTTVLDILTTSTGDPTLRPTIARALLHRPADSTRQLRRP